ncbi:MAG: GspH/FimT family pseudopilin [bacterium]
MINNAMLLKQYRLNNRGFSITELMVSIAIISILSSIAWPVCHGLLANNTVRTAATQLATILQKARVEAISQQYNVIVQFYAPHADGSYKYTIMTDENSNGINDNGEQMKTINLTEAIYFSSNSDTFSPQGDRIEETDGITFAANRITFSPRGSASNSGAIYLVPRDDISPSVTHIRGRAITVANATGKIRVWKYAQEEADAPWR